MKNRLWIYSVLLLALLAVVLWRQPAQSPASLETTYQTTATPASQSAEIATTSTNVEASTVSSKQPIVVTATNLSPAELRSLQIKQSIEGMNVPISFYGRAIDQNSNGLPGVKITFRVMQPRAGIDFAIASNMPKLARTTDANGYFSVEGISGSDLNIESVGKDGYQLSPKTQLGYRYGQSPVPLYPDPNKPVIIKMWKLGEAQTLIFHRLSRIGIPVDGQSIQFDLMNGKKVSSGGQLVVRLKRDPQILPRGDSRYDWSVEFEIPNGGLVTNNDEFMYQAPNSGYQETFKIEMPKTSENWTTDLDQQFYIQFENGKSFGSLVVHLSTIHDTPPLGLTLESVINPNGQQSLQP